MSKQFNIKNLSLLRYLKLILLINVLKIRYFSYLNPICLWSHVINRLFFLCYKNVPVIFRMKQTKIIVFFFKCGYLKLLLNNIINHKCIWWRVENEKIFLVRSYLWRLYVSIHSCGLKWFYFLNFVGRA